MSGMYYSLRKKWLRMKQTLNSTYNLTVYVGNGIYAYTRTTPAIALAFIKESRKPKPKLGRHLSLVPKED